jgi:microfibrillar-associated protein 1
MQTTKKKDAPRLAAPAALYRKGKAPKGVWEVQDSDSDYEDEHAQEPEGDVPVGSVAVDNEGDEDDRQNIISHIFMETKKSINVTLRNVNISKEGKVVIDGREESGRTITEHGESLCYLIKVRLIVSMCSF